MMLLDKNIIKRNKEGNRNIDYIARITGNLSYMGYSDDESKVTLFDINEYISDVRDDIDDLSVPADKILYSLAPLNGAFVMLSSNPPIFAII